MHLGPLVAARHAAPQRIGWCAIFTKAFAVVAARRPELRRSFLSFPWHHLFEHSANIASIAIERRLGDEEVVLFSLLRAPETRPLAEVQAAINRAKYDPIETIGEFRRELRTSRLPVLVRRLAWWIGLHGSGSQRAKNFGTFGVSATAALGASQLLILSPLTTTLYYGPFNTDGALDVRLVFDHRVVDGAMIARALAEMEVVLLDEILIELTSLPVRVAA